MFDLIAIVLAILVFGLAKRSDWHWGVALGLAAIPIAFTVFLGIYGVIIAAIFTASMYKVGT
jgi:hypothetical protein